MSVGRVRSLRSRQLHRLVKAGDGDAAGLQPRNDGRALRRALLQDEGGADRAAVPRGGEHQAAKGAERSARGGEVSGRERRGLASRQGRQRAEVDVDGEA